jgi:hypothetical protein
MDPIFTENGSVQVRLSTGADLTFVPTTPGFYSIHVNDPAGAHYSLPAVTGGDVRAIREATGMLVLKGLRAVEQAA